jgi:hypothetical protein
MAPLDHDPDLITGRSTGIGSPTTQAPHVDRMAP